MADALLLETGTDRFLKEDNSGVLLLELPPSNTCEGTSGATVTTSNSAGPDQFGVVDGAPIYDSTHAAHGSTSIKCVGFQRVDLSFSVARANVYTRMYLWIDALPTGDTNILESSGAGSIGRLRLKTTGVWGLLDFFSVATNSVTTTVPIGQWVRFEFDVTNISGSTGDLTARLYLDAASSVADETIIAIGADISSLANWVFAGTLSANSNPVWLDDLATSYTGPVGPVATSTFTSPVRRVGKFVVPQ